MHEKQLTLAAPSPSPIERLDPRIKIVCMLIWAICVATAPPRIEFVAAYAGVLAVLVAAGLRNFRKFALRFAAALPAIALFVALIPFLKVGTPVWSIGPINATREGLAAAQRVAAAAGLCVAGVCLAWATTSEADLVAGMRGVGVPRMLVAVFAFMIRYLHVLRPELHRLWDARSARIIGRAGGSPLRWAANLLGAFVLRAHGRAERVADAVAARGGDDSPIVDRRRPLKPAHSAAGLLFAIVVVTIRCLAWR